MINEIIYNKDDDYNIVKEDFKNKDKNGKHFDTECWYLRNNVKINIDSFPLIIAAGIPAQKVLYYILAHLKYGTNIISINRKELLNFIDSKDPGLITKGLNRLIELGLIVPLKENSKNDYYIPLNNMARGNVNAMINKIEEERRERERIERENSSIKSYREIIDKRKFKIKLK